MKMLPVSKPASRTIKRRAIGADSENKTNRSGEEESAQNKKTSNRMPPDAMAEIIWQLINILSAFFVTFLK